MTGVYCTFCIETRIFTSTDCELCMLWLIGTERYACSLVVIFTEYSLKMQTCRTIFWWSMRHILICMMQLISRTFDTGQLQILTNFTTVPFMTQKLLFDVLFGPEESLDPNSLWLKTSSHHGHIASFHRDDLWIYSPKASTITYVVSTGWCYFPHDSY